MEKDKMLVFVYGIFKRSNGGIQEGTHIGSAKLYNFKRLGVSNIKPTNNSKDYVEGDIYEVSKETEDWIWNFEKRCGYSRIETHPLLDKDNKSFNTISYIPRYYYIDDSYANKNYLL
jgi:hypothetical protein